MCLGNKFATKGDRKEHYDVVLCNECLWEVPRSSKVPYVRAGCSSAAEKNSTLVYRRGQLHFFSKHTFPLPQKKKLHTNSLIVICKAEAGPGGGSLVNIRWRTYCRRADGTGDAMTIDQPQKRDTKSKMSSVSRTDAVFAGQHIALARRFCPRESVCRWPDIRDSNSTRATSK